MFRKIIKNSTYNIIGWVIPIAINILAIPFFVRSIGAAGYGVWTLMGALTGYFSLVQLGLGPTVIKYISEYRAKNDDPGINGIINSALLFTVIVGAVVGIIVLIFTPVFPNIFNVPEERIDQSLATLKLVGFSFVFLMIVNLFAAIFDGLQRFDISNQYTITRSVVTTFASCLFVWMGKGLIGLALGNLIGNVVGVIIAIAMLRKTLPAYRPGFVGIWEFFLITRGYNFYVFISQLVRTITSRLPELIVGIVLGPSFVTYFSVPTRLVTMFSSGISSASSVLFPLASELLAKGEHSKLHQAYLMANKYFVTLTVPFYVLFGLYSKTILMIWIGEELSVNGWVVMSIASLTYFLSSLTIIPSQYLYGYGKAKAIAGFSIGVGIITLVTIYPFILLAGVVGASISLLLTQIVGLIYLQYANRLVDVKNREYFRLISLPFSVSLLLGMISLVISGYLPLIQINFIAFLIWGCILMIGYFTGIYLWPGFLDPQYRLKNLKVLLTRN